MIVSVLLSKIKALCGTLVLLLATTVTYDTVPDSTSNEADWVEFVAMSVLNVQDEYIEYALPDGRRIDIYDKANNVSYEVDWCKKWPEGIGQSLGYSIATKSQAGLVLLYKTGDDEYYNTALGVINDLRRRGYEYHFIVVNVGNGKIWRF